MLARLSVSVCLALFVTFFTLIQAAPADRRSAAVRGLGVPVDNIEAEDIVANRYIVIYHDNCTDEMVERHQSHISATLKKRNLNKRALDGRMMSTHIDPFTISGWRGTSLDADDEMMMDIASLQGVKYIEADVRVKMIGLVEQQAAPPGLERLSHVSAKQAQGYTFDASAGEGITAFIVDTGVRISHEEYGGRATFGGNFVDNVDDDENGHGSHVAGTVGGATFGVAKKVDIVAVKTLDKDGGGTNSGVLAGLNFVESEVAARGLKGKAVMNMSIGGPKSRALNAAVEGLTRAGIVVVVAAGNEDQNAANVSPASAPAAITVGAIDDQDKKASFSNFGPDLDIFAPGVKIQSVGIRSDTDTATLSGTSMASPHVAGLAAYLMALEKITDPDAVTERMLELAKSTKAKVINTDPETTTLIAFNGEGL